MGRKRFEIKSEYLTMIFRKSPESSRTKMAALTASKCRGLGKEAWKNLIYKTENVRYSHFTRSTSTAVSPNGIRPNYVVNGITKQTRLTNNSSSSLLVKGFCTSFTLKNTHIDEYLTQLSDRGLSFSESCPSDNQYIGQPTHVTHPHLMSDGESPINSGLMRKKYDVQSLFGWNEGRDQSQEAPLMIELQSPSPPDFFPTPMRARRGIPESAFVTPGITKKEYMDRRHNLMSVLSKTHFGASHDKHVVIIPSNPEKFMTTDVPYPFRQNTDFLYLTGFQEPDAVLILETRQGLSLPYHKSILFVRPKDPKKELWEGSRAGTQGAINIFGADEAYPIKQLPAKLIERYANKDYCIWYDNLRPAHLLLHAEIKQVLFSTPEFVFKSLLVLGHNLHILRLIKSSAEIELMRKSGSIAANAIKKVMNITRPGLEESHLHISMEYECRMNGAERLSYPPVVAGGSLANTLHYVNNTQLLRDGDLVLMDAGCEYHGYASDITRTWPVNGTFTEAQRQLYDIVLRVQKKCISLCHKDITLDVIHHAMLTLLGEELIRIGIIPKNLTEAQLKKAASNYCPHHVGHYLGMDTHDTHIASRSLGLHPGMVVTIEPGLYIASDDNNVPRRFRGIGIRIEDDVLITKEGHEILSHECPKEPEHIENLMRR